MTCPGCSKETSSQLAYCQLCGARLASIRLVRIEFTILFAFALALILVFGLVAKESSNTVQPRPTVVSPPPKPLDDMAYVLTKCGRPDSSVTPKRRKQTDPARQVFVYKQRGVQLTFQAEIGNSGNPEWHMEKVTTTKSSKQLTHAQLQQKLPCAVR
jgi:hypothetical protein